MVGRQRRSTNSSFSLVPLSPFNSFLAWSPFHWVDGNIWWIAFWLGLLSTALLWFGWQRENLRILCAAAAGFMAIALAIVTATLTTTPAEHGEEAIAAFVAAAVDGDANGMRGAFASDAVWHLSSAQTLPGDLERIHRAIDRIANTQRVQSNIITQLKGTTLDDDRAFVELACLTETARSTGLVATRWEFEVRRDAHGAWRITRIVWVRLMGEPPSAGIL